MCPFPAVNIFVHYCIASVPGCITGQSALTRVQFDQLQWLIHNSLQTTTHNFSRLIMPGLLFNVCSSCWCNNDDSTNPSPRMPEPLSPLLAICPRETWDEGGHFPSWIQDTSHCTLALSQTFKTYKIISFQSVPLLCEILLIDNSSD